MVANSPARPGEPGFFLERVFQGDFYFSGSFGSKDLAEVGGSKIRIGPPGVSVFYQLRFVRWHSPTEAELANDGLHFILTRASSGAFSVRSIEP